MDGAASFHDEIQAAAVAYCEGIHTSDVEMFRKMLHENFLMTAIAGSGKPVFWDKAGYLERVGGRDPLAGAPDYKIISIDVAGDVMAHVKLQVRVPPRLFEDYLGFFRVNGEWKLISDVSVPIED